jgi:hypothetical protein
MNELLYFPAQGHWFSFVLWVGLVIVMLGFDIGHMVYFKLQLVGSYLIGLVVIDEENVIAPLAVCISDGLGLDNC